jgi:NAD(P)-dependent dehydrogenase (short-subunit alcohol dehydrogenase family)
VTDTAAIRRVMDQAFADLGHVDVVVNNAGYGLFGAAEEFSDEQVAHELNTNLLGSIQVTRAALPHLREQGGGRIIQMSTWGGQAAGAGGSLYHASKWGIEGFMEATAKDVAPFGIGVTIIETGRCSYPIPLRQPATGRTDGGIQRQPRKYGAGSEGPSAPADR